LWLETTPLSVTLSPKTTYCDVAASVSVGGSPLTMIVPVSFTFSSSL